MTARIVPGTLETDQKKQNQAIQGINTALETIENAYVTTIAALETIENAYVTTIAGNSGAFTLNAASGITNSGNDIKLSLSTVTNSLGSNVTLTSTASYFDGPSVAQGTSGTWFVVGQVTIATVGGADFYAVKLWDGTTVIASTNINVFTSSSSVMVTLSGIISSPAGNIRISVKPGIRTDGYISYNLSGLGKDSTLTAVRIA